MAEVGKDRGERAAGCAPAANARPGIAAFGAVGLAGAVVALAADAAAWLIHPSFDPMSETISDLAAGRYAIVSDIGLYALAGGMAALALGLWRLSDPAAAGGALWRAGCGAMVLAAIAIVLIGAYSEYGDGDLGGFEIHKELVIGLGLSQAAAPLLLAPGLARFGPGWRNVSLAFAALWLVAAPPFFFVPTSIDGGYERLVALAMVAWIGALGRLLVREGRRPR